MGHGIVPDDAGWEAFGWLIVVFLFGTVLFALSLQHILSTLHRAEIGIEKNIVERTKRAARLVSSSHGLTAVAGAYKPGLGLRRRLTSRLRVVQERDPEVAEGAPDEYGTNHSDAERPHLPEGE